MDRAFSPGRSRHAGLDPAPGCNRFFRRLSYFVSVLRKVLPILFLSAPLAVAAPLPFVHEILIEGNKPSLPPCC